MARIFWVEDQFYWIDKFRAILESSEFDASPNVVEVCKFAESARQCIAQMDHEQGPDIAILDANMNGREQAGLSISNILNTKWPGLPVIFLSEHNGTEIERDALAYGCVRDFISKHQRNVEEVLCWRIKAVLRQCAMQRDVAPAMSGRVISSGALKIDLDSWEVYWHKVKLMNPDNVRRPLAPMPRKILHCLVVCSPRPVTTAQVAEFLDLDNFADASYRQHIKTLRRSLDAVEGGQGSFISKCKNGFGIVAQGEANAYLWKPC